MGIMHKSSARGIFLSLILIFAITVVTIPSSVYAQEAIDVQSISFDKSTIIEFTNDTTESVHSFRIWLGSEMEFESFKTESGWTGDRTPQGVIVFTSAEPVTKGQTVKFGVKTNEPKPGINWRALDQNGQQIQIGKSVPGDLSNPQLTQIVDKEPGVSTNSAFRIIPDKPNAGGDIRVTGNNFGKSQEFEFLLNTKSLGSFETDENGFFMTTFKIPQNQQSERIDFFVRDNLGQEKKLSLILGDNGTKIPESETVKLTIKGVPDVMYRGDFLEVSGTAKPGSAVTADIKNPDGQVINTRTAEVDAKGNWKLAEPIIVPLDTPFGTYTAEITDGREKITKMWAVESSKLIVLAPLDLKFLPGETIMFNGTAIPNESIELVLEDPLGNIILSEIYKLDDTGVVEFEYSTTANVDKEGTWTLIATQGTQKEFIYAGLGELPSIPVNLDFNKLNFKSSEDAIITFTGEPSDVISLLIISPSDKPVGEEIPLRLEPNGKGTYVLDLDGYASGIYSAVVSKGTAKSTESFSVGLQTGSGEITISTTKTSYEPGDPILILGNTKPNNIINLSLIDPIGNEVKVKETYSDKLGKITEDTFRVPSDAEPGMWKVYAKSGSNFDEAEIEITAISKEGMIISVEDGDVIPGVGKSVTIRVIGAQQTVVIQIISDEDELIDELTFPSSDDGRIVQPWIIPIGTEPGTYTLIAEDPWNTAETTYELK